MLSIFFFKFMKLIIVLSRIRAPSPLPEYLLEVRKLVSFAFLPEIGQNASSVYMLV